MCTILYKTYCISDYGLYLGLFWLKCPALALFCGARIEQKGEMQRILPKMCK